MANINEFKLEIDTAINDKAFHKAFDICISLEAEIESISFFDKEAILKFKHYFYINFLSLYILINDLEGSRFLWRRMPENIKNKNKDLQILWEIIKNLTKNNIQEVNNIFKSFTPTMAYESLINIVKINITRRELNKIAKVYSDTTLQQISDKTMLSIDEVKSECEKLGWNIDLATGFVKPVKSDNIKLQERVVNTSDLINKLTEHITLFEKNNLTVDLSKQSTNTSSSSKTSSNILYSQVNTGGLI